MQPNLIEARISGTSWPAKPILSRKNMQYTLYIIKSQQHLGWIPSVSCRRLDVLSILWMSLHLATSCHILERSLAYSLCQHSPDLAVAAAEGFHSARPLQAHPQDGPGRSQSRQHLCHQVHLDYWEHCSQHPSYTTHSEHNGHLLDHSQWVHQHQPKEGEITSCINHIPNQAPIT